MDSFFNVIALGGTTLIICFMGFVLPVAVDDVRQQIKSNNLAIQIAKAKDYKKYNPNLLSILLLSEKIDNKYLRFLVRRIIYHIHKKTPDDEVKLKYFQNIYENLNIDEIFDGIPQPIATKIKLLEERLDIPNRTLLLDLTNNIKTLESKREISKNLSTSVTIISILVTLISIIYSVFF